MTFYYRYSFTINKKESIVKSFLDFFSNCLLEYAGGRWREALENYSGLAEVSWLVDRVFFGNGGLDFSSHQQER